MLLSLSFVAGLVGYCYWRVLRTPKTRDHLHAPLDIDTHEKK
jgi:hypothetical protein